MCSVYRAAHQKEEKRRKNSTVNVMATCPTLCSFASGIIYRWIRDRPH